MKIGYKLLIALGIIIIFGNLMYLFTWTREALIGFVLGCIIGIISMVLGNWLIKK